MEHRLEVADVFRQHERNSSPRGDIRFPNNSGAYSGTSARAVPRLSGHMCSDVILAHTSASPITPAVSRHCPKCQSSARDKWLAGQARHLLAVPYCHVVFTLPHELSPIALQNPKLMYDLLFRSVRDALLTIAADPRRLGAHLGFLCVLHTWDQKMLAHPHVHCLIPAGGLSLDRSRWIHYRKRFFLPVRVLGARFRNQFLKAFAAYYRQGKFRLLGRLSSLRRPGAFDLLYKALKKKRWVVYAKRPFGGPEHVLKYLARYTHRIAIANGRLVSCEAGKVTFRWRDSRNGNAQKTLCIDAIEFIRRFLLHVLPVGFVKIRHFGFLANANRRTLLALCRSLIVTVHTVPQMLTDTQTRAVDRICPACKAGKLRVIMRIDARVLMQLPNAVLVNTS